MSMAENTFGLLRCDHVVWWRLPDLTHFWQQGSLLEPLGCAQLIVIVCFRQLLIFVLAKLKVSGGYIPAGLHHFLQPKGQTVSEHVLLICKLATKFAIRAAEAPQHVLDVCLGVHWEGLRQKPNLHVTEMKVRCTKVNQQERLCWYVKACDEEGIVEFTMCPLQPRARVRVHLPPHAERLL